MLPRDNRLKLESDIKKLFKKGKGVFDSHVGAKTMKNKLAISRFVVVVGTKVHKRAYKRNKIRRRIRSVLYDHMSHIATGFDIAIIAKPQALNASFDELQNSTLYALKKAKVLEDVPKL
ncbi:MAG TPA: ribonuclease P protein component [Patescibacteria group bacterium]|nr:ribonuclease P protein component [Patescibacteria group bacterium]